MRRSSSLGLMKAAMVTMPVSTNSRATSAMRRMFSRLSAGEKPRLLFMPERMLSPSSMRHSMPRRCSSRSMAMASVLLPEPLRPVIQSISPRWPSRASLSARVSILSNMG